MTYTPEQLREWAGTEGLNEDIANLCRAHADLLDWKASIEAAQGEDVRGAVAAINVALCGDYLRHNDLATMRDKFKPCEPKCECVGLLKARALLESLSAKLAECEAELKWSAAAGRRTEREYEDHHKGQEGWTFLPEVGMWARLDFDHHAALARAEKAEAELEIARASADINAKSLEMLYGQKFSDRNYHALKSRAEKAEAEVARLRGHAEAMADELKWIAELYDDSKSTVECASDAYDMKSVAANALHAYRRDYPKEGK